MEEGTKTDPDACFQKVREFSPKTEMYKQKFEEVMHWRTSKCGRTKMFLLSSITQLRDENIVAHSTSKQLCICADYENPVSATM